MLRSIILAWCLTAIFLSDTASAFISHPGGITTGQSYFALGAQSCGTPSPSSTCERSVFLKTTFASIASITTFTPKNAFAEEALDDLSMPSESEQKAADDAMAERLRIKAELKKKASKPMGYKESMEAEKNKQKSLQKTKEEQRAAMCEELGRGC
ncbi:hypothetical protein ACHAWU_001106 [Discostella pseudostelligera]|uniref:Secreted protein n=1 Tax=Discostella pseudostelligera TaxID=259834 RepID=A0ABD3MJK8_9STRA